MADRRGVLWFLVMTFGLTWGVEGAMIASGVRFSGEPSPAAAILVAIAMWFPALCAVVTVRFVSREPLTSLKLRLGPPGPYLACVALVPACFAAMYGVTWAVGLARPDWNLEALRQLVIRAGTDPSKIPSAPTTLALMFFCTTLVTPFINGLFGFGEELGWRGFLLSRLMPLGKARAYLLLGIIWGLWHAPLVVVGFNYPGHPVAGIAGMCLLTTTLGILINELTLRHESAVLAGWLHGLHNSQAYGLWRQLFPEVNPLLGGCTGLVGSAVWLVVGLAATRLPASREARP